uniref:Immunoglobulin V-set domain-containing protein n=1 Tax=Amphilophus citrinellus TaxID=61819 RepID=A0A3Q0RRP7_AMPCI
IHLSLFDLQFLNCQQRSLMIGQNFSYWCKYDDDSLLTKFICKGDDPSTCQPLVNTTNTEMNMKFSMTDNKQKKNISITMREVTVNDSGTYWCGSESTDRRRFFIHKLSVTVGESCSYLTLPASVSPFKLYQETELKSCCYSFTING